MNRNHRVAALVTTALCLMNFIPAPRRAHCIAYLRFYLFIYFFSGNNSYISKQYKDKTSELIKVMAECLHLLKQVTLRNINAKIRLKFSRYVLDQLRITNIDHKRWR